MRRATETADVSLGALPAVTKCASVVDRSGAVGGTAAATGPSAVVQMVGASRRVLDFGEGRDEVCKIKYMPAELGGKSEETEGFCMVGGDYLMVTAHCAKSGVSSEFLEDRVGFACEADSTACKERRGGERGEYAMSCFEGGDIADEVEVEC